MHCLPLRVSEKCHLHRWASFYGQVRVCVMRQNPSHTFLWYLPELDSMVDVIATHAYYDPGVCAVSVLDDDSHMLLAGCLPVSLWWAWNPPVVKPCTKGAEGLGGWVWFGLAPLYSQELLQYQCLKWYASVHTCIHAFKQMHSCMCKLVCIHIIKVVRVTPWSVLQLLVGLREDSMEQLM